MVWTAISCNAKIDMVDTSGKIDLVYYNQVLETKLLPVAGSLVSNKWSFQQDNATVRRF